MDWIVHIGYQKTGSKALQRFFAEEPHRRPGTSLLFPSSGRESIWHLPMREELARGETTAIRAAVQEAASGKHDVAVLSSEGFSTMPPEAVWLLRGELGPARIVIFLRRQDELANSILNQIVMAHRFRHDWIEEFEASLGEYDRYMDYQRILSTWSGCFGAENVLPIIYDKREDAAVRFGRATGIEVLPPLASQPNPNPALDAESYRALRELKKGAALDELPSIVQRAHEAMGARFIDTFREPGIGLIDAPTRAAIIDKYRDSNEWVRKHWFPERASLFDLEAP